MRQDRTAPDLDKLNSQVQKNKKLFPQVQALEVIKADRCVLALSPSGLISKLEAAPTGELFLASTSRGSPRSRDTRFTTFCQDLGVMISAGFSPSLKQAVLEAFDANLQSVCVMAFESAGPVEYVSVVLWRLVRVVVCISSESSIRFFALFNCRFVPVPSFVCSILEPLTDESLRQRKARVTAKLKHSHHSDDQNNSSVSSSFNMPF